MLVSEAEFVPLWTTWEEHSSSLGWIPVLLLGSSCFHPVAAAKVVPAVWSVHARQDGARVPGVPEHRSSLSPAPTTTRCHKPFLDIPADPCLGP